MAGICFIGEGETPHHGRGCHGSMLSSQSPRNSRHRVLGRATRGPGGQEAEGTSRKRGQEPVSRFPQEGTSCRLNRLGVGECA